MDFKQCDKCGRSYLTRCLCSLEKKVEEWEYVNPFLEESEGQRLDRISRDFFQGWRWGLAGCVGAGMGFIILIILLAITVSILKSTGLDK